MSRIMYPEAYAMQRTLLKNIKTKDTADGLASPLKTYLPAHGIVLATDEADGASADTKEAARILLSAQSENFSQLRDLKFSAVFKRLKGEAQFLKGFYKPNVSELGNWGITVNGNGRLVYPADFSGRMTVFTNFKTKHSSFPVGTSPLEPYLTLHGISMANDATDAAAAVTANTSFLQTSADAEDATQDRDNLWNPVMKHVRGIGDFLKKLYKDNAKQLGYWGFVVDDSPRAPKLRTVSVLPAATKIVTGVIVGGTLKNVGPVAVHVYKGKTTAGTPAIVQPGEMLGMNKGSSVVTIVDPSSTEKAKITVLVSR